MGKMSHMMFAVLTRLTLTSLMVASSTSLDMTTKNLNNSCPQFCSCTTLSPGHEFVTCQLRPSTKWETTCVELQYFASTHEAISLKVSGDSSILFDNMDCLPVLYDLDLSILTLNLRAGMFEGIKQPLFLNLSHIGLEEVPEDTFSGLSDVISIDLSHNDLSVLNPDSFRGLDSLTTLDLSHNRIERMPVHSLSHLSTLETLNIEHNVLSEITADHFPASGSLRSLNLHANKLSTFILSINDTEFESLQNVTSLDLSYNPLDCSCIFGELFVSLPSLMQSFVSKDDTVCSSPDAFKGRKLLNLNESELQCTSPENLMSFPSNTKPVLITDTITLECHAQGYPRPAVLWITPWGEKFYNRSLSTYLQKDGILFGSSTEDHVYQEYEDENVFLLSSIRLLPNDDLELTQFRGCLSGMYRCVAINFAGNQTQDIHLEIISAIKSVYGESLFIGGCCAVGFLIFGFFIGAMKMLVVWLRHKHYFNVPIFSKTPSEHPVDIAASVASVHDQCNSRDIPDSCSEKSPPSSPLILGADLNLEEDLEEGHHSEDSEHPGNWRPHAIFETLEEARGRFRYGMGRKMDRVRKNVQSIKESGSVYVHSIRETSSSAASRMKAGMALGVETVKSQVQSFKELCGTGNMGGQTISMMSVETDVDTNEKKEVIRQITFV